MNSQKFKTNTYCVGGKHYSGTKNFPGERTINKKTGKDNKLLVGKSVICDRKKSIIVSDNTKKVERLGSFSKTWERLQKRVKKEQLMRSKIQLDSLKSMLTLLRQRQVEIQKQHYQHYQK